MSFDKINLRYESSRYENLVEEYSEIRTAEDVVSWRDQAQPVISYIDETISSMNEIVNIEKEKLKLEIDKDEKGKIKLSLMQYTSFVEILQMQAGKLNKTMDIISQINSQMNNADVMQIIAKSDLFPKDKRTLKPLTMALIIVAIFTVVICAMVALYPYFL
ncbi:hypothetical protein ANAEL_05167 [Anaerolineales bacterium]|nr:hypothetical protein ANAEL_05167 [Anaerolineales bacterium]